MQCAEQLGCDDSIIKFVLPLGSTVNMNGTALYEATTVIFIAQVNTIKSNTKMLSLEQMYEQSSWLLWRYTALRCCICSVTASVPEIFIHAALHASQTSPVMVLMLLSATSCCFLLATRSLVFARVVLVQQHEIASSAALPLTASGFWHRRHVACAKAWHCVVIFLLIVK